MTQPEKGKVSRSAKDSARGSLFLICGENLFLVYFYYNVLVIYIDSRLPIVLFVGQHFSGSLFRLITLLL